MNNQQFRRFMSDNTKTNDDGTTPSRTGAPAIALGAKKSSFVPMTPRTVKGGNDVDFARQVRERNEGLHPTKKFKSSAPKGSRFAAGYTDRAKARAEAEEGDEKDDKAQRIKALEEQMKLDQITPELFEALRDEITGGDVSSTHLVKGLDRKLLERVRRGEDVMGSSKNDSAETAVDIDEELGKLEEQQVEAVHKERSEKKGSMAPPSLAGKKRSRDEIMAEFKAQRKAAAEAKAAAEPSLDSRWRRVDEKVKSGIQIDRKGREVLITVDEDGMVKKKVRKVPPKNSEADNGTLAMPDARKEVLGADVIIPEVSQADAEKSSNAVDSEDDIFEGVGTDYNPLGHDEDSSDDDDGTSIPDRPRVESQGQVAADEETLEETTAEHKNDELVSPVEIPAARRNYFNDKPSTSNDTKQDHLAGIQAVLKKAARLAPESADDENASEDAALNAARRKKHAQMLANQDRDLEDMDMGFGGSRYDDAAEQDEEGQKIRLSEWKGNADDGSDGGEKADKKKKARKPKKRKGDANNMSDIMRVIEGRKEK